MKSNIRALKRKSVVRMAKEGKLTKDQIAEKVGISSSTVFRWLKKAQKEESKASAEKKPVRRQVKKIRMKTPVKPKVVKKPEKKLTLVQALKKENKVQIRVLGVPNEDDIKEATKLHHVMHALGIENVPSVQDLAQALLFSMLLNRAEGPK